MCLNRTRGLLIRGKGLNKALAQWLEQMGIRLITKVKRNLPPANHTDFEKVMLKKQSMVEMGLTSLKMKQLKIDSSLILSHFQDCHYNRTH